MSLRTMSTKSDWLSISTDIDLEGMSHYLNVLSTQLKVAAKEHAKRVDVEAAKIEDERSRDEFYEFASEEHWSYTEGFPNMLYNSLFLASYAFLENEVYHVARLAGKKAKEVFDVSDIGGQDYLESANVYMQKLTPIRISSLKDWQTLKEFQRLRNIIAHENGKINVITVVIKGKQQDSPAVFIAKKHGVYDTTDTKVKINYDFCHTMLEVVRSFFAELYGQTKANNSV